MMKEIKCVDEYGAMLYTLIDGRSCRNEYIISLNPLIIYLNLLLLT